MNQEKFKTFSEVYAESLLKAMFENPDKYGVSQPNITKGACFIAEKMLQAIKDDPKMVNYTGDGFKKACKTLGIKQTRKAIFEYLEIK